MLGSSQNRARDEREAGVLAETVRRVVKPRSVSFAYLVVVAILCLVPISLHTPPVVTGILDVKSPGNMGVEVLMHIVALAGTWAAGLFAGAATVTVKGRKWSNHWSTVDGIAVVCVLACGALIYYGVYWAYVSTLGMVAAGGFSPFSQSVLRAVALQYYAALAGTILLGFVFARLLDRRVL